jgi:prepilin-type N-terminal cleavage/methylation domain-containing protein
MKRYTRFARRRNQGFTLLEVLIVVMYIAIIAGIIVPRMTGVGRRAGEANLQATVRELRSAVASFQAETGLYPAQLDDIVAEAAPAAGLTESGLEAPIFRQDFHGPYLIASGGRLPVDRTTGNREWVYETSPPRVGAVRSSNPGTSLDGKPYAEF